MPYELLTSLALFAFVSSITPGPNNLMLMASGANFGFRRTIPHLLGVSLGFVFMASLLGTGLMTLFDTFPITYVSLKIISVVYLLYLSWKIATAASNNSSNTAGKPFTFLQAASFQWVNPKVWAIAITVASGFMPLEEKLWIAVLFTGLMSSLVSFPCISMWALFGSLIKTMISNQFIKKFIECLFALLLVLTGFYLVLN